MIDLSQEEQEAIQELICSCRAREDVVGLILDAAFYQRSDRYTERDVKEILDRVITRQEDFDGFILEAYSELKRSDRRFWGSVPRDKIQRTLIEIEGPRGVIRALYRYLPQSTLREERALGYR